MKKFLLLFAAMFMAMFSAVAGTVIFNFTEDTYGLPNDGDTYVETPATITSDGVTITLTGKWRMWSDGLRAYSKSAEASFTVKATEPVTYISWTVVSGAKFALDGTTEDITEWSGSAESVTFNSIAKDNKAVKTITVIYGEEGVVPDKPEIPNYNVAQTIEAINGGYTGEVIVTGLVTRVTNFNSTYGSLTYFISDDGSTEIELQVYGGLGLNGTKFESLEDLAVGAKVVVQGNVKLYNDTPEVDLNSVLLEYTPDVELSVSNIAQESDTATYYTLQGVKTTNPSKGIYIVRKGNKVSKTIVK